MCERGRQKKQEVRVLTLPGATNIWCNLRYEIRDINHGRFRNFEPVFSPWSIIYYVSMHYIFTVPGNFLNRHNSIIRTVGMATVAKSLYILWKLGGGWQKSSCQLWKTVLIKLSQFMYCETIFVNVLKLNPLNNNN